MWSAEKRAYTRDPAPRPPAAAVEPAAGAAVRSPLTQRILEGAPLPLLLRMASPNAIAFLVQASVSVAEVAFVGRLGAESLAALALMFPGLMLMQMLANGAMGGAVSSAVARAIGAGDRPRAEALIWHALLIAIAAGLCFLLIYAWFGRSLLASMGVSAEVMRAATGYGGVIFGGAAALWIAALASAVFRGMGNMRFPATLMVIGALVQVPLAGTLILGWFGVPAFGVQGAAIAVVAVAAANAVVLLVRLAAGRAGLTLGVAGLALRARLFADILRVGALASLSPLFVVATIMCLNALIGTFGVAALAGYGIVARLEFLLVPMVFGIGAALTALVGVNVGAGQVGRAERIAWAGAGCAAVLTGVVGLVLAVAPGLWLDLFTGDAAARAAGEAYLHIVGPLFAFQGLGLSLYFASQGAGTVVWPVVATVLRFAVSVGGAAVSVFVLDLALPAVYACLAAGMLLYGALTAASIRWGAWRRSSSW